LDFSSLHLYEGEIMTIKLTDTQRLLLSAAASRNDRCLAIPKTLKGGAARQVVAKLVDAGLAREIAAKSGLPVWRREEETGRAYAVKMTVAGVKAVANENPAVGVDEAVLPSPSRSNPAATRSEVGEESGRTKVRNASVATSAPRAGTKIGDVVNLIQRDCGATLEELVAATGWLPHTARAALTGLRKRGFAVSIDRSDKTRGGAYRIICDERSEPADDAAREKARSTPAARGRKKAVSKTLPARKAA
jgi:Protein of unknown function (DUF3489)